MRKWAKKPELLKLKKEVALLIKAKCKQIDYKKHPHGCYWKGHFEFEGMPIYIYWQNYVSNRMRVRGANYIRILYKDEDNHYANVKKSQLNHIMLKLKS